MFLKPFFAEISMTEELTGIVLRRILDWGKQIDRCRFVARTSYQANLQ